jgi:hypothetical protein
VKSFSFIVVASSDDQKICSNGGQRGNNQKPLYKLIIGVTLEKSQYFHFLDSAC